MLGDAKWRPIDTAPRDETLVLLSFPHGAEDEDQFKVGFWSVDGADWFDSEAASRSLTDFGEKPSHWMPLTPPA